MTSTDEAARREAERRWPRFVLGARWAVVESPTDEDAEVEFPQTIDGVTIEQDDWGVWVTPDGEGKPYWIGPRALKALESSGMFSRRVSVPSSSPTDEDREALATIVRKHLRFVEHMTPDVARSAGEMIADRYFRERRVSVPPTEDREWIATLEALIAEVYGILKPIATTGTHSANSPILRAFDLLGSQDFEAALTSRTSTADREYGYSVSGDDDPQRISVIVFPEHHKNATHYRRPASPWLPVPTEEKNP